MKEENIKEWVKGLIELSEKAENAQGADKNDYINLLLGYVQSAKYII